MYIAFCLLLLM